MIYDRIIGQAPATNPELFKAAILNVLSAVERRLDALELKELEVKKDNGS